jgi:hypothetical protein
MTRVMIDFETYGLRPDCVVLSFGAAVVENPNTSWYAEFDINNQPNRNVEEQTLVWWNSQKNAPIKGTMDLREGIADFNDWFLRLGGTELWANGTDFDIPILNSIIHQYSITPNWKYNSVRDYRTLKALFPQVAVGPFIGKRHNALDDATNQANHLNKILLHIGDLIHNG